jgi:acetyl-CoA carboxylase biotin carboxyl carrier protein
MDIPLIKKLIHLLNDNNLGELKVQEGDFKVTIRHRDYVSSGGNASATPAASVPQISIATKSEESGSVDSGNAMTIKAPMIGTFYRSSAPDKPPYVKVGDRIKKGDVLCVIEAMKLFNEIQSEVSGKVIKVMADNAQAVEYDQPLFLIEPL